MAVPGSQKYKDLPLKIVGSNKFGRFPKMSSEETFNMIVADDWLVGFAGWKSVRQFNPTGEGRGIYSSTRLNKMFIVIDDDIISLDSTLSATYLGTMTTFSGDVFIAENTAGQIAFSDSNNLYVYTNSTNTLTTLTPAMLGFTPGYITFQNGRFISPALGTDQWRLSDPNDGTSWPSGAQYTGAVQTKPDNAVAAIRFPGAGNMLLIFGQTVAEPWYDLGLQLFPYQRSTSTNFDYGCLNPATIAESEDMVAWLAINEKSGPVISYTDGRTIKHISTDGIDFVLSNLTNPSNSFGYMLKLSGHLFYVITFKDDNLTYAYDFNTDSFYTLTDENMGYFIPRRVAFFNDQYYFVSIQDGNLYELSADFNTYDYGNGRVKEIPRIRVCPSVRLPDQSYFIAGYIGFTLEQGTYAYDDRDTRFILVTEDYVPLVTEDSVYYLGGGQTYVNDAPRVDLSLSKDGGVAFGSSVGKVLNPLGRRKNRLMWYSLGIANDLVPQFRFHGFNRWVVTDGIIGVFQ